MTKIEVGKTYQTRNGREARIFATDLKTGSPIVGAVIIDDRSETLFNWKEDGSVFASLKDGLDLIIPPERKSVLVNWYGTSSGGIEYKTREEADNCATDDRTHVLEIIIKNDEPVDVKIHKVER